MSRKLKILPNYYYNELYSNKRSLENVCISFQEEFKNRKLLTGKYSLNDHDFYIDYLPRLLKILGLIPHDVRESGSKALDIGCGEGRLILALNKLGFDAMGIDAHTFQGLNIEGKQRRPLLENYLSKNGLKIFEVDIENNKFPLSNDYFDIVFFIETIEHLHNSPRFVLKEIFRVLKDGGYLVVATPNYSSFDKRIKALLGYSNHCGLKKYYDLEFNSEDNKFLGHIREFTLREIEDMLKYENFEILHSETYFIDIPNPGDLFDSHFGTRMPGISTIFLIRKSFYSFLTLSKLGSNLLPNILVIAQKKDLDINLVD